MFKCHEEVLYLQPLIPLKRFDIFSSDWRMLRPFLTRKFFQEILGLERSKKNSCKNSSGAQSEDLRPSLTIQEFFSRKYSWFYMQRIS